MLPSPHVRNFSRFMGCVCGLVMWLLPLGLTVLWFNFEIIAPDIRSRMGLVFDPERLDPMAFAAGLMVILFPAGILVWGLFHLRRAFGESARGHYFSLTAVAGFRRFAWSALLYALALPVQTSLMSLVLTWNNPPGQRQLIISIGTSELHALFVAVLFVAIAHIFEEGRKIADENAGFL